MNWINDGLPIIVNSLITEYDIAHGNTSIMREYQLAPPETMDELDRLEKDERNRRVGLMQRNNKPFATALENGFNSAVDRFIAANKLDPEVDILAIRKDAIFVVNRPVEVTSISDNITFRPKNEYHAHLQIGPRWEFYFKKDGTIDIKNFIQSKNDTNNCLEKLKPGPLAMLSEFIDVCESTNMDKRKVYEWLREFARLYKAKELDVEYYREFTTDATFRLEFWGEMTFSDIVSEDLMDNLMIDLNYINLIIPLIRTVI